MKYYTTYDELEYKMMVQGGINDLTKLLKAKLRLKNINLEEAIDIIIENCDYEETLPDFSTIYTYNFKDSIKESTLNDLGFIKHWNQTKELN